MILGLGRGHPVGTEPGSVGTPSPLEAQRRAPAAVLRSSAAALSANKQHEEASRSGLKGPQTVGSCSRNSLRIGGIAETKFVAHECKVVWIKQ